VELGPDHRVPTGELPEGQAQRLVLACALLADTTVLVLDEPTAHLRSGDRQ